MIAIVDGGATKCDWVLLQENGKEELLKTQTIGLNPNIIAHDKIAKEIEKNPDLIKIKNDLKNIYFVLKLGTKIQRFLTGGKKD